MNNSKRINILFVHTSLNLGGAEELRRILLKHIDLGRYKITVCCLAKKGPIGDAIEGMGFRVIEFGNTDKAYDIRNFFSIFKMLGRTKFDIVQPCMFIAAFFSVLPAWFLRVPVIIPEEHCREVWKKYYHKAIDRISFGLSDKIIAVSEDVKRFTARNECIPEHKFIVLPNTADEQKFAGLEWVEGLKQELGINNGTFLLGSIGRLHRQKDYPSLFLGLRLLIGKFKDIKLLIVGSGPLDAALKARVRQLGIENAVIFLGERKDIDRFFKTIDLFVLSSIYEGQPVSILEAMASAKPIVATNVGGVPELVNDRENGILVPSGNPEKLAEAIESFLKDKGLLLKMGERGRERFIQHFSPAHYARRMESLYERLLFLKKGAQ